MTSTSMSEPILEVDKLNLVLKVDLFRSWTLRDHFVKFSKDPLGTLFQEKDRLNLIQDLSFKVHEGERVGLLGVNGVGKTSLCRCIAGMYGPSTGKIKVQKPVRAVFNTQVGIMPELTGRENAMLLATFLFPEEKDVTALVEEALEFSELGKFVDVPFRLYSNGMQTRLSLSLISARPSRLLILDEVFDGADQFFRKKVAARVMSMIDRSGAVLFVSHDVEQVRKVCNRVLILHQSRLIYDGPTEKAFERFQDLRPDLDGHA
ncbi:MAG: ATP-binding cassette domain-containing protein [Bdellovibrionia bacterium]